MEGTITDLLGVMPQDQQSFGEYLAHCICRGSPISPSSCAHVVPLVTHTVELPVTLLLVGVGHNAKITARSTTRACVQAPRTALRSVSAASLADGLPGAMS